MRKLIDKSLHTLRHYPISLLSYIFLIYCWYIVVMMFRHIRLWNETHKPGYNCINGQAYGFLLASLLSVIFLIVIILYAVFKKNKSFYIRMIYLLIATAIAIYFAFKLVC